MYAKQGDYPSLERRARRGDKEAAAQLRRQLEPQLPFIVRRALRDPTAGDYLAAQIQAEAHQVGPDGWKPGCTTPESLVHLVARRMLITIMYELTRPAAPPQWEEDAVEVA